MKRKLYTASIFGVCVIMFLSGWLSAPAKPMYDSAPGSLAKEYKSMKEVTNDSPIIVQAEVMSEPDTIQYQGLLFSSNQVKVSKTLKGNLKSSEITVLENGGVYQGKEYGMGGMPLMHKGEKYLLYLYKYEGPVAKGDNYMIRGIWQGKVKIGYGGKLEYLGPKEDTIELQNDLKKHQLYTIQSLISQE